MTRRLGCFEEQNLEEEVGFADEDPLGIGALFPF